MRLPGIRLGVHPLSKYRGACPTFKEPRELVSFSYDEAHKVHMDDRELKYYVPPVTQPPPCLFDGYESRIERDSTVNGHIDGLLTALAHVRQQAAGSEPVLKDAQADFVMYRGMLTRLFVTPFSLRDAWSMNATKVGSTIYIEDNVTDEQMAERQGASEIHKRLMYSGYKFETLCVVDKAPQTCSSSDLDALRAAQPQAVVNTNTEYCSVFRTQLGHHSIVSGAEVDCIDQPKPAQFPNRHYRELKTNKIIDSPRAQSNFERFKLLKFWAQSFIAGIPTVTVGFRDDDGVLRAHQTFETRQIPRLVRGKPRMWEANVCMNFADQVLQLVKDGVKEDGPETQYRIEYDPEDCTVHVRPLGKCPPFLTTEYLAAL
ncbi:decapping endonuclease targeting mRNA [Coemansia sp. RSA 552]|nr:decapping endonuclease targeting mRNA [Coemansia sp. RSA 552]